MLTESIGRSSVIRLAHAQYDKQQYYPRSPIVHIQHLKILGDCNTILKKREI